MRVGAFEIDIRGPWPCWIDLKRHCGGGTVASLGTFDHRELRALEFAVQRAIHEVREKLPESCKHEMD